MLPKPPQNIDFFKTDLFFSPSFKDTQNLKENKGKSTLYQQTHLKGFFTILTIFENQ